MTNQSRWLQQHDEYIQRSNEKFDNRLAQPQTRNNSNSNFGEPSIIKTYPAGVISGLTELHQSTVRRYVILFRKHFSEGAQQPTRGRRFTNKDAHLLVFIRQEFKDGKSIPEIESELSGEWKLIQRNRDQAEIIKIGLRLIELQKELNTNASITQLILKDSQAVERMNNELITGWKERINQVVNAFNKHYETRLTKWEWLKCFFADRIPR